MNMQKHKFLLSLLIFILLSGCAYYNTFYNAQQYFKQAQKQIRQNKDQEGLSSEARQNLDKAISKSRKVLIKYPDSRWADNAQYLVAIASFHKGNYTFAKKEFEKFLFEYPESNLRIKANIWYGKTLWNMGQKDAALQQWESTAEKIKTDEVLGELYYLMGESFREKNRLDSAVVYYRKTSKLKKSERRTEALFNLVDIAISKGHNQEAATYLDQLSDMVLMPEQSNKMQVLQVEVYRKQGKYEKARNVIYKKLNSENFKDIWGALELQLALMLESEGNIEKAISKLEYITENYKKTTESARAFYELGEIYTFNKRDYEKAVEYYSSVSKESNQSEYKEEANKKKTILNKIQKKSDEFNQTQELINRLENKTSAIDSTELSEAESDTLSREELKQKVEEQKEEQAQQIDTLATYDKYYRLPYEMAEIYYFDLNLQDTARTIYRNIANSYKYNPYVSKAIYALYYLNIREGKDERAAYYKQRLEQEYPDSPYLFFIKEDKIPEPQRKLEAENIFVEAENRLESSPDTSINIFKDVVKKYPDTEYAPKGALNIAWLFQNRFYSPDSALKWYHFYVDSFPQAESIKYAQSNINKLNKVIEAMRPDTTDSTAVMDSTVVDSTSDSLSVSGNTTSVQDTTSAEKPDTLKAEKEKEPPRVIDRVPRRKEEDIKEPKPPIKRESPDSLRR